MKKHNVTKVLCTALLLSFLSRSVFAFSQQDLVSGGSVWLETTIIVALSFFMVMALSLQVARSYFLRILNKFTLRLGADIWWLAYVLIRDGLMFVSFIMGLSVFLPGTFQDYPMAVPFMPLAVILVGAALVVKLYYDADENRDAFRVVTILLTTATVLWFLGMVIVTETPTALPTMPSDVNPDTGFWGTMFNIFSSTKNVGLSWITFKLCFAALGILGALAVAHPLLQSRLPKEPNEAPKNGPV